MSTPEGAPAAAGNETLLHWVRHNAGCDAEFGAGLSNHLSMTLLALHELGADAARQQGWALAYAARLQAAPPAVPWPAGEAWRGRLGRREAYPPYRALFVEWLDHEGAGETLRQALPWLLPGVGAAAFHGLIRTACAVRIGQRQELADALAYWGCRWLDLGGSEEATKAAPDLTDPVPLLQSLRVPKARSGLIFEGMRAAAALPGFDAAVRRLQPDEETLPTLARLAAQVYAASGNFAVLHLVTGAHALQTLGPWIEDPEAALRHFWRAYAAAAAASGAAPDGRAVPLVPWPELKQRAIASDDEHVIKLVWSCSELERALDGPEWQAAASRAVL